MLEPQTTVVIAVWGDYVTRLAEAVSSIREQGVPVRIVVVDNASEQALPPLDDVELERCESRVELGAARNRGFERVTTPNVVFWDADDLMLPGTLSLLEQRLAEEPRLAVFATAILEGPSGLRHRWPRRWIATLSAARRTFALLHSIWSLYPSTGATIMRSELVRDAGVYAPISSGEDWVLGVSLAYRGRIGWSERPGRLYRMSANSVSARETGARQLLRRAAAVRKRLRTDPGIPSWARIAVPLIGIGQRAAIALHLAWSAARRLAAGRPDRAA